MELKSLDSTKKVAEAISINLKPNDFVLLSGNLGAGKTTFTRFLIHFFNGKYQNKVYVLPKHLDEKVAMLHLAKVGAKLTKLSKEQADYISVSQKGPFKPDTYRY